MARLVKRTQTGPISVRIEGEEKWICRCGLSKNQPFCDGSHKLARSEEPGKLYWYDDTDERRELGDEFTGMRAY